MSPLDPRLERHRPALVYDPQEAYRAMSAASITDYDGNALRRRKGAVVAKAGAGLALALLSTYEVEDGDQLDEAKDTLAAARRFQGDAAYRDRVYGRVAEDGDRVWLQYWLWSYYNPKHLLGLGKHEGDWELVQIALGDDGVPEAATFSQHENGEARSWDKIRRHGGDHPIVYVAPLSHACYFEPGAHPYVFGVDNPDGTLPPVLPHVEPFDGWETWPGRWGSSTGVGSRFLRGTLAGRFGGRSPVSPACQGQKWDSPTAWHTRARAATPLRQARRVVRAAGTATYPKLLAIEARREGDRVLVDYRLDPAPLRRATYLLVTLHRPDREAQLLATCPEKVEGTEGTVDVPLEAGIQGEVVVRASAYNALRQRSDPLETVAHPTHGVGRKPPPGG